MTLYQQCWGNMTADKSDQGNSLPSPDERPVAWVSLFRTARAPLAVLLLAAVGLILPPQTDDMLAALMDGGKSAWLPSLFFQVSLAVLSISAWYWARTLIDARFDVVGTRADRRKLVESDPRINPFALAAVPWLVVILSVLLGLSLIPRGQYLPNLVMLAVWVAGFAALAAYSWSHPAATQKKRTGEASTSSLGEWLHSVPSRLRLLARRAPGPAWIATSIVIGALVLFALGAAASFVRWQPLDHIALPSRIARIFPGPSAALICLGLIIGPLSVLTFLFDGLRLSWTIKGQTIGLVRPPVILLLLIWIGVAPYFFSLHTVRVVPSDVAAARDNLGEFFTKWASACAPPDGSTLRPIIVAVSGGASRAAVWGASVLQKVEEATPTVHGPTVFAVSSVSGGSLGVAAYMALLRNLPADQLCAQGSTDARKAQMAWLGKMPLAHDALGPLLAATVAVDAPRALLSPFAALVRWMSGSQPWGGDRAEWIERAFEGIWKDATPQPDGILFDAPFLSLFYDGPHRIRPGMPIWIANGTETGTGGRLFTVPFAPDPAAWPFLAARDVLFALQADVSISTAINNTARFPYLEPSGELLAPPDARQPPPHPQLRILRGETREIIDGGYFENEGLQTALELARWLKTEGPKLLGGRSVAPIIVQATGDGNAQVAEKDVVRCSNRQADDPRAPSPVNPPLQLLAPIFGLNNVRGGHAAVVLRTAKAAHCADGFFHLYLPGETSGNGSGVRTDVPLNWVLSDGTTAFIRAAIEDKDIGNADEGQRLATILAH
jgi:cobalamin synthase